MGLTSAMPTASAEALPIGVALSGISIPGAEIPDLRTRLRMASEAGVFDFVNRAPPDDEFPELFVAANEIGMRVLAGTFVYVAGRDEALFERNIVKGRLLGSVLHDVQLSSFHDDGHLLSNDEVADLYMRFFEFASRHEVTMGFEVHVNTWSEHFGRVEQVANLVERRGAPFCLTFDPSHVIFKIDNPHEQRVQDMQADINAGRLVLEPGRPGNVLKRWIEAGYVVHCHARSAVPNNPLNVWARHLDGSFGRGIQYPLIEPQTGEWHSPWTESRLDPWKATVRNLLHWHRRSADSQLRAITCEFIPAVDYGGGAKYSILAQNIACAMWLRATWREACDHEEG